jgi:hypothetical protein
MPHKTIAIKNDPFSFVLLPIALGPLLDTGPEKPPGSLAAPLPRSSGHLIGKPLAACS